MISLNFTSIMTLNLDFLPSLGKLYLTFFKTFPLLRVLNNMNLRLRVLVGLKLITVVGVAFILSITNSSGHIYINIGLKIKIGVVTV